SSQWAPVHEQREHRESWSHQPFDLRLQVGGSSVDHTVPERGELAAALRWCRAEAGLSYDALAEKTGLSAATLKRAASGKTVPAEDTVRTIASACGGHPEALRWLWLRARIADRGRLAKLRKPGLPQFIDGRRELSAALEYFYEAAGAPSLRRLAELAGGKHMLPVSSASRIVNREALPVSRQQMIAFLTACGMAGRELDLWADAFEEITQTFDTGRLHSKLEGFFEQVAQSMESPVRLHLSRPGREGGAVGRGNSRFVPPGSLPRDAWAALHVAEIAVA
ncbi:helix-turn-helix domain-containing protein, partial [Streptomyces sp. NPDC006463]|uniref:helix-turn-helix domain-containing protein n=1 Tax=Streptomyces sp. NPDC006463 TaxID=3364746 RepID=UPI00367983C8